MPKPRYTQISLEATPYYHCVSRCVRRAFLCGTDSHTGQSFEHRKDWIESKILELAEVFALDVCAYAVMSNHYHIVLHINQAEANSWSMDEVIKHWHKIFRGNVLSQRYIGNNILSESELVTLEKITSLWRKRLMDISWFMRVLNETIARRANTEDDCSGRFWEGRYKTQALLDEAALLACMAYVDLNPMRAQMAETLETSEHTSINLRINDTTTAKTLHPFVGNTRKLMPAGLPFKLNDYLELVDWTGRIQRQDKCGYIRENSPEILQRLNQTPANWLYLTQHFESKFKGLVGAAYKIKQACETLGYKRTSNLQRCLLYFS
ncbi:MAG: transposase [Gammaproteobacteria bacterium]|nr:transposase [Gammaproteobacteria bacterium]